MNRVAPRSRPALPAAAAAAGPPALTAADEAALTDLYVRGTPANTLRAYERDLVYLTAWKQAAFGLALAWPEAEAVALRFVLDHAADLAAAPPGTPPRRAAEALMALGLRRSLACPAPATLDRRIASWQAFHRMRNLASPFDAPLVRQARGKARRAAAHAPARKSKNPITREVLEAMLATCAPGLRGLRDRAILMTGFASGGRRRSELAGLDRDAIGLDDFAADGVVWIRLGATKTTRTGQTPRLVLKGRPARALVAWIDAAGDRGRAAVPADLQRRPGARPAPRRRGDRRHRPAAAGPRRAAGGLRLGARPAGPGS